ncbi:MAG: hypothetical protein FJY11_10750, partial [Bacteroidetes bacterium]|nr:hypothetical protein [Bacteroidota bacterium]
MKPSEKYEKSPFRVPDNYFSELNDRIIESTIGRKKTGLTAKLSVLKPLLSLAAVIAGAAVITLAVLQL